jgi:hypothetical protein
MGALSGSNSVTSSATTFNLSSPAQTDYIVYPATTTPTRKSGAGSTIIAAAVLGAVSFATFNYGNNLFTWTGGAPTASGTAVAGGIYTNPTTASAVGQGIRLVLPADTNSRTAVIYWGANSCAPQLVATLSDGSATPLTLTPTATGSNIDIYYAATITFAANSAGQTLTIDMTVKTLQSGGNIFIGAAKYLTAVSSITGSGAGVQNANTSSASGTVGITGSGAGTQAKDTAAATGTVSVSGAAASTQAPDSAAATGAVGISGTGAVTEGKDVSTGTGAVAVSGSAALTEGKDVSTATGAVGVSGAGSATQAKDNAAATGAVGVAGLGSASQAKNTGSATATVGISGSGAATQAKNTSSATAQLGVSGAATGTQQKDVSAASGATGISGAGAATQQKDSASAAGAVEVSGAGAATQQKNTASGTGVVLDGIVGSGAGTQAPNAAAATGTVSVSGSAAATQAKDTSSGTGTVGITGAGAATQAKDTSSGTGTVGITGSAAITQQPNVSTATGAIGNVSQGSAAITQQPNAASGTGTVGITGTGAATQKPDASAASAAVSVDGSAAASAARDGANGSGAVEITGTGAATQARNVMNGVGSVSNNEITGTGAGVQAPNVSAATGAVEITGTAAPVQRANVSHATAFVDSGEAPPAPSHNPVLNKGRTMKWFQAGEDLTFDIEILVGGVPSQPDPGTVTFTVRDQNGVAIPGLNNQPVNVPGTTASISVPAASNMLADGAESESRFVTLAYIASGQSRQLRTSYSLHAFLPIEASCDAVRSLVGVSSDELPDDDIALVLSYFDLVAEEGDTFKDAFLAKNQTRAAANRALALRAALEAVPSLQLRIFQSRQSENSSFSRFGAVDWERLKLDLRDQLAAALKFISSPTTTAAIPTYFMVSAPTDNVTNS